jgi:calcium binding protein 39
MQNFDAASDAFLTFRELLTTHKAMVANFLVLKYDVFFARYKELLQSDNYVTRRQGLKVTMLANAHVPHAAS